MIGFLLVAGTLFLVLLTQWPAATLLVLTAFPWTIVLLVVVLGIMCATVA